MTRPMRSSRSRGSEKAECCTAKQTSHVWGSVETYGPQMFHGVIGKLQGVHMLRSATVGLLNIKAVITATSAYQTGLGWTG